MNTLAKTPPKLIVLDLDGTALNSKNELPDNLYSILKLLKDRNKVKIVLASGRSITSMKPFVKKLNIKAPVITLNGGVIIDSRSDKIFFEKNLSEEIYNEGIRTFKRLGIDFVVFTSSVVYADKVSYITDILKKYTENEIQWIDNFKTIKAPVKILFIPKSTKEIELVKKATAHMEIDTIDSGFNFVEIVPKGVNKGEALKTVSEMLNINPNEIIAFGDNENDIEMLRFAGTGVAMGNAPDHVKKTADIITDTNDNSGIYKILNQIFNSTEK